MPILKNVKVDFQVTGWCSEQPPKNKLKKLIVEQLERTPKTIKQITDTLYDIDENRVIFLTDYYNQKYKRVVSEGLKEVERKYLVDSSHSDTFIGISKNGKNWLYIVRGIEIMTDQGHFLAAGISDQFLFKPIHTKYKGGPNLRRALTWAKEKDALIIASHPLSEYHKWKSPIVSGLLYIVGDPSGMHLGLDELNIRKYADFFDALEKHSLSMSLKQRLKVEALAQELHIPTVVNTDGTLDLALTSYNFFREIDFSSRERLRQSVREGLKHERGNYSICKIGNGNSNLLEKIKHIAINLIHNREYY
ncbi:MAG: hypothetical protein AABY22_20365 [Nanoarchaeota archaeon]